MTLYTLIFGILTLSFLFIVIYKGYFISVFVYNKDPLKDTNPHDFSLFLLISVKNESKRLSNVLQSTLSDDFLESGSKIIVIDDYSSEEEFTKMKNICVRFENVDIIQSRAKPGKKHALKYAIENCDSPFFAFTDADCSLEKDWFSCLRIAAKESDFIMGYAPFYKKKGLLNSLQRYECMWIACQYMAYALSEIPYMAVGRNMGASAQKLKETIPLMKAGHLLSGDDDMLVQALNKSTSISVMIDPGSFAYSEAETTYSKYLAQKQRQITTSMHYKIVHKILLGSIAMALILFYLSAVSSLFFAPLVGISFLIGMGLINVFLFWAPSQKFKENDLKWKVFYLEIVYVINIVILGLKALTTKSTKWK